MLRIIAAALRAGRVTAPRREMEAPAPTGTKGRPHLDRERCDANGACQQACPTGAISLGAPIVSDGEVTTHQRKAHDGGIAAGPPGADDDAKASEANTGAIGEGQPITGSRSFTLDYGACIFCGRCAEACAPGAMTITADYALSALRRDDLVLRAMVAKA